ncbi:DNA replication protein DnaD [Clostridium botulinum]|uniref:DnaA N-terminal domain-containing protein n=1 Tax=Clostridium botulinum TaxID=1491 RepID=UPI000774448F|nr:DnaA N-terminal domain-containing protein [Clostridium botulinum]NFL87297.1 DNA replication protein DnaD [Clostridium botulinum]NFO22737.1 DNA replication protein DnaD [Clostridium botulinum]
MNEGWIKLHRCLFEKAIWQNSTPEHKVILITLLGMANHSGREWEWKGKQFKANPGMLVTSLESICNKCGKGISIQNVRSALKKFEKFEFLTQEVTKTGRLITIVNWGLYQGGKEEGNKQTNKEVTNDQQSTNKEPTNSQQTGNKEPTTNKNDKNIKNVNNDKEYEEGKEIYTTQLHLSFPTQIHELIFNQFGETSYRTWFEDSTIEDNDNLIIISVKEKFKQQIIQDKYLETIKTVTGKEIEITGGV